MLEFYTVVDTSRSPVHNIPCPLHWVRDKWTDYEVGTGLEEQHPKVLIASLRSVMGKECLQILLNLKLAEEERTDVDACLTALECYFKPKRNIVYERYMFNTCMQNIEEPIE